MTQDDLSVVDGWHAHVYFDAATRDAAHALRQRIVEVFGDTVAMGRFHERPVGPHPRWSYQLAFAPVELARVATWLALNHDGLDVFLHPNTGDALADHRDRAMWIGRSHALNLGALGG
ncbi:DOPA 4,5-dioxygenase family protein [Bordetella genomosp. 11]|uniref:4,5-dioxygenase n=1 Tax=Bordetella genomosp. 11 TaxID=1416808 RepID=A0A261V022_9BORD|nr:DOPA 4,5-dioxygenase family protein [Bordetella genomosp. 11]OZI66880.1 4,5-dioxygenase [Bordetella genomosp. 11]